MLTSTQACRLFVLAAMAGACWLAAEFRSQAGPPPKPDEKRFADPPVKLPPKVYEILSTAKPAIAIDGRVDEPAWAQAVEDKGFCFPWEKTTPPSTVFRAIMDDEFFYFAFEAADDTPMVKEPFADEQAMGEEDRVELFFAPDKWLKRYFCIEIDPQGRLLDYAASYHRKFDYAWKFPKGLTVAATRTKSGYVVEGRIALAALKALGMPDLRQGESLTCGIFRADLRPGRDGKIEEHWISWVDPKVVEPDFHTHSAFGVLRMKADAK